MVRKEPVRVRPALWGGYMAPCAILRTEGGMGRSLPIGGSLRTMVTHSAKDTKDCYLGLGDF